ncbi:hypothetical protein C0J52_01287 [Blattella germanica]|nr:hypothetical protein C0J52_01287 [Blattella germanica]
MNLYTPSEETVELVRKEFKLNDRKIKEALDHLKQWLEMQPHLPNTEEDNRLERWLINCKNNLERTKETIDIYYSLKTLSPEIMSGRDSSKPWFKEVAKYGYAAVMPELTPEGDRISVYGVFTDDASTFVVEDMMRLMLMCNDVRLFEDYYLKNIFILDLKNLTMGHVMKSTPTLLKKYILFIMVSDMFSRDSLSK